MKRIRTKMRTFAVLKLNIHLNANKKIFHQPAVTLYRIYAHGNGTSKEYSRAIPSKYNGH